MSHKYGGENPHLDQGLAVDEKVEEPKSYKVLMHNDDYTPMNFVIFVLKKFFSKADSEAMEIMFDVHNKGLGVAGVFSFEVAETKVTQVNQFSKNNQYPLKTSYEEA